VSQEFGTLFSIPYSSILPITLASTSLTLDTSFDHLSLQGRATGK